jgi:hypothetical protein
MFMKYAVKIAAKMMEQPISHMLGTSFARSAGHLAVVARNRSAVNSFSHQLLAAELCAT